MYKINIIYFITLFSLFSNYSNAQIENKAIDTGVCSIDKGSLFFNRNNTDRITLPFGYSDISKQGSIDVILSTIQNENKLKELHALNFEKVIKKDLILLPEEYDIFLPFSENVNEQYDRLKIASNFLSYGVHSLYFVAVYNTVRYAEPFIEKVYLISTKDSKLIDMKRIYLHHEGEMGFAHYSLFNITENYIISIQDYEFGEDPLILRPLRKYQILPSGKFSRYYDNDGFYKSDEEQGMVKSHKKEGKWIEFKSNGHIDLQRYSEFTDPYTYLEAEYKDGSPVGTWNFYKLLQKYNDETGGPILNTRKKGRLIYTEIYSDGILEKRDFRF